MKVCIIGGTGYVGLVTGVGLAAKGHDVICADIDVQKIEGLGTGILPIYEEGLPELLAEVSQAGKIQFTTCVKTAVGKSDIVMVAVGTPETRIGDTDFSQLLRALKSIAGHMEGYKLVVIKSTVPVGTCEMAKAFISNNLRNPAARFDIVSNPEFLREGSAVRDFLFPERIVIGTDTEKAKRIMEDLYKPFLAPMVSTDPKSSEMIKYACNSYLAARISFINEIAEICEKVEADITSVVEGMKLDQRIGAHYLNPGPGFGGPCLSKDLKSLINFGSKADANLVVLKAVLDRNEIQIRNIIRHITHELKDISGKKVAVLGLSFKAGTNDTRNSPALQLLEKLAETKAEIIVYDPVVKQLASPLSDRVQYAQSALDAADYADCLVIMTEWEEFKNLALDDLYRKMRTPVIYDTRNILSAKTAQTLGFYYKGTGTQTACCVRTAEKLKHII